MIVSFGDAATGDLYHGRTTSRARRFPPHVAALRGDMTGRCSMRVNIQWRLIFRWDGHNAHDVTLIDYHG